MDRASDEVRAALVEANRAYEERFGHVFLIFATGRTDTEMLAAAQQRLGQRRGDRAGGGAGRAGAASSACGWPSCWTPGHSEVPMTLSTHVLDTGAG